MSRLSREKFDKHFNTHMWGALLTSSVFCLLFMAGASFWMTLGYQLSCVLASLHCAFRLDTFRPK